MGAEWDNQEPMKKYLKLLYAIPVAFLTCTSSQALPINTTASSPLVWYDTGISVTNGEWMNINAEGFWVWPNRNSPDGILSDNSDLWLANGLQGSLIAYVGSDPLPGSYYESGSYQDGRYWELGTARQFISNTNGTLWLGINDDFNTGNNGDNYYGDGPIPVTVWKGFDTNSAFKTDFVLTITNIDDRSFGFTINGGIPETVCGIYASSDLIHWTLIDSLILSSNGSSLYAGDSDRPAGDAGLVDDAFVNHTAVPYRFYKASNGQFWSKPVGFVHIDIPGHSTNSIANQMDDPYGNTLNDLFNIGTSHTMIDGNTIPSGTEIWKWNGSSFDMYTWSGTSWSPNGAATLNPGEGAFLINHANTFTVTFAGTVREGQFTIPLSHPGAYNLLSSAVPQAGPIKTILKYAPNDGDQFFIWSNNTYFTYTYDSTVGVNPDNWYNGEETEVSGEPILQVGQPVFIIGATNNWSRYFKVRLTDQ